MTHPFRTDFWYGWPAVIAVGYAVIAFVANPDMPLLTRVWAGLAGGVLLVAMYWALYRVGTWLLPIRRRRSQTIDD